LDKFVQLCGSDGTNAWTATDNTCYTISTAGIDGLLTVLPVFLDHILFPLLTEECFTTEVHHVDGEGKDGGSFT
jgi:Zn-dependent M16 (insulinase) family peptidase